MGKYIGPVCRLCRREGLKLYLKGEKCYTDKCPISQGRKKPGEMPKKIKTSLSEYGIRFREKQKLRRIYNISERQIRRFLSLAREEGGVVGDNLISLLERRLDNVIYRAGYARSRREARILVAHKHLKINGHYVNIPSYIVQPGEKIEVVIKSEIFDKLAKEVASKVPQWMKVDQEKRVIEILRKPEGADLVTDVPLNMLYIIEYYSR